MDASPKLIAPDSAAAVALRQARDAAVERCRGHRPAQDAARGAEIVAEKALVAAKERYAAATGRVSDCLTEITQLQAAFQQLTGRGMPPTAHKDY